MDEQQMSRLTRDTIARLAVENEMLRQREEALLTTIENLQGLVNRLQAGEVAEPAEPVEGTV